MQRSTAPMEAYGGSLRNSTEHNQLQDSSDGGLLLSGSCTHPVVAQIATWFLCVSTPVQVRCSTQASLTGSSRCHCRRTSATAQWPR